ncbi:hypothetical protein, partial [Salmonella sp. SAL4445]|uniref:hypothetical protein n=1 Tax=Salmonella sp. SAL4445 TaxID=3159900 RepID=UPI00397D42A9
DCSATTVGVVSAPTEVAAAFSTTVTGFVDSIATAPAFVGVDAMMGAGLAGRVAAATFDAAGTLELRHHNEMHQPASTR